MLYILLDDKMTENIKYLISETEYNLIEDILTKISEIEISDLDYIELESRLEDIYILKLELFEIRNNKVKTINKI